MKKQNGFTIVELMISTTIFSFILLIISFAAIFVGRSYYKAVTSARAQEASRSTMETITRNLEFTGSTFTDNVTGSGSLRKGAYCIGTIRYTFATDKQVSDENTPPNQQKHALWQDKPVTAGACIPVDLTLDNPSSDPIAPGTSGREILPAAMRLTELQINQSLLNTRYFNIKIGIIAGDDDLIDRTSGDPIKFKCLDSNKGGHFCSAAPLTTTVYRRLVK